MARQFDGGQPLDVLGLGEPVPETATRAVGGNRLLTDLAPGDHKVAHPGPAMLLG